VRQWAAAVLRKCLQLHNSRTFCFLIYVYVLLNSRCFFFKYIVGLLCANSQISQVNWLVIIHICSDHILCCDERVLNAVCVNMFGSIGLQEHWRYLGDFHGLYRHRYQTQTKQKQKKKKHSHTIKIPPHSYLSEIHHCTLKNKKHSLIVSPLSSLTSAFTPHSYLYKIHHCTLKNKNNKDITALCG
jgi:hypothetical protein